MLSRIILIVFQLAIGWRSHQEFPWILAQLQFDIPADVQIFAYALLFAIVVWAVGLIAAIVLKDAPSPVPSTLATAILGALVFAGLTLVPEVTDAVGRHVTFETTLYPLIGAVIGYAIKR